MSYRVILLAALLITAVIGPASAGGRSVDDMVGVFSIEKTIKLGSSSACFGNADGDSMAQKDPLGMGSNSLADSQAPDLAGFGFEPKMLAEDSRSINLTVHIIDDESGLGYARAFFSSPSGAQTFIATFTAENRASGTFKDGIYTTKMILPKESEKGAWLLDNITLMDASGNRKVYPRSDLIRLSLPVEFLVT